MLHQLDRRPRFSLLDGPTPIQRLTQLEQAIGQGCPPLYVKRDDLGGVGGGGNKLRKLEFLVGEAVALGCDTFITVGARQSNHARLSAAAAARAGLACELVLTNTVARDDEAYLHNGNVLLDDLFGAIVHRLPRSADALSFAEARAEELNSKNRKAYVVGSGGSSPVGCLGYANCAAEILRQEQELGLRFAQIIVPNGSSGTHAGLVAGMSALRDDPSRVRSFTVLAPLQEAIGKTHSLATATLALLDRGQSIDTAGITVSEVALGEGYGIPTIEMLEAVRLMARKEGLLLDPVYSGKAFAGLLSELRAMVAGEESPILYIMTGGTPGLFAYQPAFDTPAIRSRQKVVLT